MGEQRHSAVLHGSDGPSVEIDRPRRFRNAVAMEVPETRFARVGYDRVAYQVFGEGPSDLLYVEGTGDAIDLRWDWPPYAYFLRRLASFSRVVTFDARGQGGSDRVSRAGVSLWE